jgi:drug/metabolite transporter (DMT)-like permease
VVAVMLGWLLVHEPLSLRVVLASVAILGAIVLIRRGEQAAVIKPAVFIPQMAEIKTSQECA